MPKIVDGIEYLSYDEAADQYGLSRKSVQSMVSRDVFKNAKFPHDGKAYISREELDAYKRRKNKTAIEPSTATEKERSTQDAPFSIDRYQAETERKRIETVQKIMEMAEKLLNPIETHQIAVLKRQSLPVSVGR